MILIAESIFFVLASALLGAKLISICLGLGVVGFICYKFISVLKEVKLLRSCQECQ